MSDLSDYTDRFPTYTEAELAFDRFVHLVGVPTAMVTAAILVLRADETGDPRLLATMALYGLALVATLGLSAAYNLATPGPRKELLRRCDRSMIYAMIAASYTPFALNALDPADGMLLCVEAWSLALIGIGLEVFYPRRFERESMVLYIGLGWLVLSLIRSFADRLPEAAMALLLSGGVVLTIGAFVQSRRNMLFHNAVWHVLVLIGVGLHVHALRAAFLPMG